LNDTISIRFWLISLLVFVLVVILTSMVTQGDETFGIIDHQAAGTASRVDEIQAQWREGGVRGLAIIAVIADLAWIWMYALSSFAVGRGFATERQGILRSLGLFTCGVSVVFGITDYTETMLQFIQLLRDSGSDQMAGIAAAMQPIKIAAFFIALIGIIFSLFLDRLMATRS